MPKQKSTPGGKANRTNKEQTNISNPANIPDINAAPVAQVAPTEVKPETSRAEASKPAAVTSEPRKFELHKSESRKNVVPINLEDEIRRRAYELFQQRQPGSGTEAEDWLTAEREVMQRYHQQSA